MAPESAVGERVVSQTAVEGGLQGKGKGKGKTGAVPPPPKSAGAKPAAKPLELKVKVRDGSAGLESANYTVMTALDGSKVVHFPDGTTKKAPRHWDGDLDSLDTAEASEAPTQWPAPEPSASLRHLLETQPELQTFEDMYQKGVPLQAVRSRIQGQYGDKTACRFCEAHADTTTDSSEAPSEVPGTATEKHGLLGDTSWPAAKLAAACSDLARPGYNSGQAHEFLDEDSVVRMKVKILADLIKKSRTMAVYAGAGLSTASGINDYATRTGAQGVVATAAPKGSSPYLEARPNLGHRTLAALVRRGHVWRFIQQNHDGLPQKAGVPQHIINEIHGSWFDPSNPVIMMSGQLRNDLFKDVLLCERKADLVLVLGSSLAGMNSDRLVRTVSDRARVATAKGPPVYGAVIVSLQTTPHDKNAALRIFATIDRVMELLAEVMCLEVLEDVLTFPQVEAVHRPLGTDVDVFNVPYDENGYRIKDGSTRQWDLREGAQHVVTAGNGQGWHAVILGKKDDGSFRVGIKDPRFVQAAWTDVKLMGAWWIDSAVAGNVEVLPIVNRVHPQAED